MLQVISPLKGPPKSWDECVARMVLTKSTAPDIKAKIEELLAQRDDQDAQERLLWETRLRVQGYEDKFGIPSERIHQAIDEGTLAETLEVCHWIMEYDLLCRARSR
jgi:hypothetical protein